MEKEWEQVDAEETEAEMHRENRRKGGEIKRSMGRKWREVEEEKEKGEEKNYTKAWLRLTMLKLM